MTNQKQNAKANAAAPGRVPPANLEAEMSVLGAMMLGDKDAVEKAISLLKRDDFHRDKHAHIFDAMVDMANAETPVEIITLREELARRGILEDIGGVPFLIQLGDIEFTTANIEHYAQIVKEKAILRQAIEIASVIAQDAYEPDGLPLVEFLDKSERLIFGLRETKGNDGARETLRRGLQTQTDLVNDRYHNYKNGIVSGLLTGFNELDYVLRGGLKPGLVYIVGGRPGMGKTVTGLEICRNILRRASGECGHFQSLEMTKGELIERMVCAEAQISTGKVAMGDLNEGEWAAWMAAHERLYDGRCIIDDTADMTPLQLKASLRKTRAELGRLDFVVIDYLQLLDGASKSGTNATTNDKVTHICSALKSIAKEFDVPVIALSQMSRANERREDKRPNLSDLRDSGAVEQVADVAILLYRAAYYDKSQTIPTGEGAPSRDEIEFNIAKHRNGATGIIKVAFTPEYTRLDNLDYRHEGEF